MRAYTIANIGSMVAMLIGVVNIFTFREIWILLAAVTILVILAIYAVKEKRKLQQKHQHKHNTSNNHNYK
jgi:membrane protein implicated in regulation of membrane protease activity